MKPSASAKSPRAATPEGAHVASINPSPKHASAVTSGSSCTSTVARSGSRFLEAHRKPPMALPPLISLVAFALPSERTARRAVGFTDVQSQGLSPTHRYTKRMRVQVALQSNHF